MEAVYENRKFVEENFPITLHTDRLYAKGFKKHNEANIKNNLPYTCVPHWHEGLEILRIIKGSCEVVINTDTLNVGEDDIIIINSNSLHRINVKRGACVYDCLIIDYSCCLDWGFEIYEIFYHNVLKDQFINKIFEKLHKEFFENGDYRRIMITAISMELLTYITRKYRISTYNGNVESIKKIKTVQLIIKYITRNFHSQNILEDLSRELGYSRFYLAHIFAELTGLSIRQHQMMTRFNFASKLLKESEQPISEISKKCGYVNSSSFSAAFKKKYDRTPLEYRLAKTKDKYL